MILPAVRERLEAVLRHPGMEGALSALRSGTHVVSLSGLHDVAKALVAAYYTHELRRPAFFITASNRRAESLTETLRFFSGIFPGATGGVAALPAFDTLPWDSRAPHADILERRAAALFRLTDGQVSLLRSQPPSGVTATLPSTWPLPARSPKTSKSRTKNSSPISPPSATRAPRWSSFPANFPFAAASLTCSLPKRNAPSESNFLATLSSPSANLIRVRSAPLLPSFAPPFSR